MCGWYIDMRENSLMFGCSDDNNINYLNLAHEFHTKKNKITHATLSRVKNRQLKRTFGRKKNKKEKKRGDEGKVRSLESNSI